MAELLKFVKRLRATVAGSVVEGVAYAVMLALALIFMTGNGQFIYEAF